MERYINADKLCNDFRKLEKHQNLFKKSTILAMIAAVENVPTVDVAPRAEVAREIFAEIEKEIEAALESNYKAQKEHSCNDNPYIKHLLFIVEGKISALRGIDGFIAELKKKYTGDKKCKSEKL